MTFSKFDEHLSPLFKTLNIIKLYIILCHIKLQYLCISLRIDYYLLCTIFFFTEVSEVHQYNTRSAAKHSYCLPTVRTNYGKFQGTDLPRCSAR